MRLRDSKVQEDNNIHMNYKAIQFYLGLFIFPLSGLSFLNILYSTYFDYFLSIESYLTTLVASLLSASGLYFFGKNVDRKISFIDQLILGFFIFFFF